MPDDPTSELWARRYLDEMNDIILVTDMATGIVMEVNERGCEEMGWSVDEVVGHQLLRHVHPDDIASIGGAVAELRKGITGRYEQRWRHSKKGWRIFDVYGRLIDETRLLICGRDITALKASEEHNHHLNRLVELTDDLLIVTNNQGEVLYHNDAAAQLHGKPAEASAHLKDYLYDHESLTEVKRMTAEMMTGNHRSSGKIRVRRQDGSPATVWCTSTMDPKNGYCYTVERDMTDNEDTENELKRLNEDLTQLATIDALTGLANRTVLTESLDEALADPEGRTFALLLLDVDNFKLINDTMGHTAGDLLLQHIANRLRNQVGPDDVVARFGGDEFVILVREVPDARSATELATALRDHLSAPYVIGGRLVHSTCSIGIALSNTADTAGDLIRFADIATYQAKDKGRNRYELFDATLRDEVDRRFALESGLRFALGESQIGASLQGIFSTADSERKGFEALVRWDHPELGSIPPEDFVQIADDCHLLNDLTVAVLTSSLEQISQWLLEGDRFLTINVAPSQLQNLDLIDHLTAVLEVFGVGPADIIIEITEVGLKGLLLNALPILSAYRDLGYRLAIDDFGKGASSLGYLRDLPISMVKIDAAFVHRLTEDASAATITEAVIQLAKKLGLTTVAECVETPEQLIFLTEMGCEHVQGFMMEAPLTPLEQATRVARHSSRLA